MSCCESPSALSTEPDPRSLNPESGLNVLEDMTRHNAAALVLAVAVGLPLAACSGSTTTSPTGAYGPTTSSVTSPTSPTKSATQKPSPSDSKKDSAATLTISGFAFSDLTVKPGVTVTVENQDSSPHTVAVKGTSTDVSVPAGGKATFTAPDKPGSYALSCDLHPQMAGQLTVAA